MLDDFRPDVEGLRAVAVIAVVLFHARLLGVAGGFVGVDVFFVLSGFLITRLLLRELESTGSIALPAFWARRARRLLPAAALTVVVTVLFARQVFSPLAERQLATDVIGAGTFTSNFVFAHRLGDYFGARLGATNPSPLLHFWSLAVEEQFYLCWPLLLVLLTRRPRQYRRLMLSTVFGLGALGFLVSARWTATRPSWAFYSLPARMGELLAGAALAAAGPAFLAVAARGRAALGWLGVAGLLVALATYDESMAFPGTATILPVAATMAVIVAGGAGAAGWAPLRVLGDERLQWVGRHSYAIYLWHWPVLVLAEARWGPLSWVGRCLAIGFAVLLSFVSVRLLEEPVRHSRRLAKAPFRSLALGAALLALVVATGRWLDAAVPRLDGGTVAATPVLEVDPLAQPVAALAASPVTAAPASGPVTTLSIAAPATTAPVATVSVQPATAAQPLATPEPPQGKLAELVAASQHLLATALQPAPVPSNLRPSLGHARERSQLYRDGCVNVGVNAKLQPCTYGVAGAPKLMVLYGDSHAAQWFEALEPIATANGYELVTLIKGGCPVGDIEVPTPVLRYTCPAYRDKAVAWLAEHHPSVLVVTSSYTQYPADATQWATGVDTSLHRLAGVTAHLVVLGDNPVSTTDPPGCLSDHIGDASACATARSAAVQPERIAAEVTSAAAVGAAFVDTSDWFCTPDACPVVLGDILLLRDDTHLTVPAAQFFQPLLAAALAPVLVDG